jgi:pyruvate dehydrogenase E1 component beta subunit
MKSKKLREITYAEAISEGSYIAMERDDRIFIMGIGADYTSKMFGTTTAPYEKFGKERVFDVPAMENALTGMAVGAAIMGKIPMVVHYRNDFMFLSLDALINLASKWQYMFDGNAGNVPMVVRGVVGRGWGQGATHSQSIHATLAHYPGLNVIAPYSASDAKGMLISALEQTTPVVIIEHRSLFNVEGPVDQGYAPKPLIGANIVKAGNDVTLIGISQGVEVIIEAANILDKLGISAEVIDIRSVRPLDKNTIVKSSLRTRNCVIVDSSWVSFGVSAEIAAVIAESSASKHISIVRLGATEIPAPASQHLESHYYPTSQAVLGAVSKILDIDLKFDDFLVRKDTFMGPY